jgi:hypothetical protein
MLGLDLGLAPDPEGQQFGVGPGRQRPAARADQCAQQQIDLDQRLGQWREALAAEEVKVNRALAAELRRLDADVGPPSREVVGTNPPSLEAAADFDRFMARDEGETIEIATAAALQVLDILAPSPPDSAELHQVRVMIHGETLRVVLADDLAAEVLEQVEAEVADKRLGPDAVVLVQCEPGLPADGFQVAVNAEATPEGSRWSWRHDSDDEWFGFGPGGEVLASEAAAVDATWTQHAADRQAQDRADL